MCDRQGLISLGLAPGGILGLRKEKDAGRHFGGSLGKPLGRWAHGDSTAARRPGIFADPVRGPFGVRVHISESLSWKLPKESPADSLLGWLRCRPEEG